MRPATVLRATRRALGVAVASGLVAALVAAARPRPEPPEPVTVDPPPLPPGRTVAVPGRGELFVRDAPGPADAPTILLLHGWMVSADVNWYPSYAPLARLGRVLAPDHRGHGRGPRPPHPFRIADAADDAAALLRHLDAGPAIVVGYSMGGAIAQVLYRRHPQLVRGLVLCGTAATFNDSARDRWLWRGTGLLQLGLRLLPRTFWERTVRAQAQGRTPLRLTRLVHPGTPPEVVALLPWMVGELGRGDAEDVAEAGRELARHEARDWLGDVDVPVTVLATSQDQLVPVDRQRQLARHIPGARLVELPLDHDAPVGAADTFVSALVDAVCDVRRRAEEATAQKTAAAERVATNRAGGQV